jgi:hypothetical protein
MCHKMVTLILIFQLFKKYKPGCNDGRLRQDELEVQANQGHIARPCLKQYMYIYTHIHTHTFTHPVVSSQVVQTEGWMWSTATLKEPG